MGPHETEESKRFYYANPETGKVIGEIFTPISQLVEMLPDCDVYAMYELKSELELELEIEATYKTFKKLLREVKMIQRWECRARQYQRKAAKIERKKAHA